MPDTLRFPFSDCAIVISNVRYDRFKGWLGTVRAETLDGQRGLAAGTEIALYNERQWRDFLFRAASRNGQDRNQWLERGEQIRFALDEQLEQLSSSGGGGAAPEEDTAPQEEAQAVPSFPEAAWRGSFAGYRRVVGPTTEAPDVYHFFCFAVTFGAALGRRVYVYHAVPLYPNFYVALVGRTGIARKDTARARSNKLLQELHTHDDPDNPQFLLLPGIGSAEGLIECLGGDGKVVVAQEAELLSLMAKAKRDSTSNLLPHLTSLYDCPDLYTLRTRSRPVTCRNTFTSLLAGTTPTWLQRSFDEEHALSGFANRFMFVFGDPKGPIPFPPPVDPNAWSGLVHQVNGLRQWADAQQQLEVGQDAIDLFSEWYSSYHARVSGEGVLPALAVRFQTFAWKVALLYAVDQRSPEILVEHLKPALQVADWLWDSNRAAFVEFVSHGRGLEDAILERLKQSGRVSNRALYRALKVSAGELERATGPLLRMGLMRETEWKASNGKTVEGFELV